MEVVEALPDKGAIGKKFRKDAKALLEWLAGQDKEAMQRLESELSGG